MGGRPGDYGTKRRPGPGEGSGAAEHEGRRSVYEGVVQELIDELSRKYTGKSYAEFNPASGQDAARVVVRVTPDKVVGRL